MSSVYIIKEGGRTVPMNRVRCENEDVELQALLQQNLDLLPGEQINPEDPRRWLPIKREMPVPDPGTGADRWSIDFLLADQDGVPTFVECKRYSDTRSRREVVGQMLEYAANGHYYWGKDQLRELAEESARNANMSLDGRINDLQPTDIESIDGYFERVQENLREAQLRIIFFLEEAPFELRSVVDFLNTQMERSEVLLVEARQYEREGLSVVAPMLFGYTETARQVKRTAAMKTGGARRKWDIDLFMAHAASLLSQDAVASLKSLHDACLQHGCEISWGTGAKTGSYSIKEPEIAPRSLITISSDGCLSFNFGWLNGEDTKEDARQKLKDLVLLPMEFDVPEGYENKFLSYPVEKWVHQSETLGKLLCELVSEYRSSEQSFAIHS